MNYALIFKVKVNNYEQCKPFRHARILLGQLLFLTDSPQIEGVISIFSTLYKNGHKAEGHVK